MSLHHRNVGVSVLMMHGILSIIGYAYLLKKESRNGRELTILSGRSSPLKRLRFFLTYNPSQSRVFTFFHSSVCLSLSLRLSVRFHYSLIRTYVTCSSEYITRDSATLHTLSTVPYSSTRVDCSEMAEELPRQHFGADSASYVQFLRVWGAGIWISLSCMVRSSAQPRNRSSFRTGNLRASSIHESSLPS